MRIFKGYPPNIDKIDTAFKVKEHPRPVFFCYGDVIYNPAGVEISPWIMVHESVHCKQQGDKPDAWWDRYIEDVTFRLEQEIEAHRAEWLWWSVSPEGKKSYPGFRSKADFYFSELARKLSSSFYGNLISLAAAKVRISRPEINPTFERSEFKNDLS